NSANTVIANVPEFYEDEETKDTRLGEGHFIRAFNYFKLVKQYGGVPLKLEPSYSVELEFTRASAEEVYNQVIEDFTRAYELLPPSGAQTGRITKWAAAHFLAKAYLFRASELYADWNGSTRQADLEQAIKYGREVIEQSGHSVAANFRDLWHDTEPNSANETLPEIILAAQFSNNNAAIGRYGNQMHVH